MIGAFWQLTFDPTRWFTKVEPGQLWIWNNCDGDPFDCEKIDTIWINKIKGNYVQCTSKVWFDRDGQTIQITYKKALFNQDMFHRIK